MCQRIDWRTHSRGSSKTKRERGSSQTSHIIEYHTCIGSPLPPISPSFFLFAAFFLGGEASAITGYPLDWRHFLHSIRQVDHLMKISSAGLAFKVDADELEVFLQDAIQGFEDVWNEGGPESLGMKTDILSVNLCNYSNQFLGHYQIGTMQQVKPRGLAFLYEWSHTTQHRSLAVRYIDVVPWFSRIWWFVWKQLYWRIHAWRCLKNGKDA